MYSETTYATLSCTYITETLAAYLFYLECGEVWIPKSVCIYKEYDDEVEIAEWFLKKNDLPY